MPTRLPLSRGEQIYRDLGLDWFLLNLLLLSLIFVPLERLFPRLKEQGVFRYGWKIGRASCRERV